MKHSKFKKASSVRELRQLFNQSCTASGPLGGLLDDPATRVAHAAAARDARPTGKVLVECIREGGKVRVRVISKGYSSSKNCQFPREIREEGRRFLVDSVVNAGTFYRVRGEIVPCT